LIFFREAKHNPLMAEGNPQAASVALGLRVASASAICLVVTELFHLQQAALGVYTAHLVMVLFPITSFQKGLERFLGRGLGLLYGLILVRTCLNVPLLFLALVMLGQIVASYIYLSGRLAYAALMAALFVGVTAAMGLTAPATVKPYFWHAIGQLLLGEAAAFFINWITGAERTVSITVGGQPLFPLRGEWVNIAFMLSVSQMTTLFVTLLLDLPITPTMISALIIGITAGSAQAAWHKARQRSLGAWLGGGFAFAAMLLLALIPSFLLLLALVFFAMFLAAYGAKTSANNSYVYLQMGLVAPLVLIGPTGDIGSITLAIQRLVGVWVGLFIGQAISLAWPHADIPAPAYAAKPK
jgi:uncharacterized membrane protein YccC